MSKHLLLKMMERNWEAVAFLKADAILTHSSCYNLNNVEKIKFSIKDFFIECDQFRRKLQIWSHLLKKPLMENFIFCIV